MDALFEEFPGSIQFENGPISLFSKRNLGNGLKVNHKSADTSFTPSNSQPPSDSSPSNTSSDGDPPDHGKYSNPILSYISEMLMDEDMESKTCMLQDCLALQAAEKSLYDVLGQDYPPSSNQIPLCINDQNIKSPEYDSSSGSCNSDRNSSYTTDNLIESNLINDMGDYDFSLIPNSQIHSYGNSLLVPDLVPDLFGEPQPVGFMGLTGNMVEQAKMGGIPKNSKLGSREKRSHQREGSDYEEGRGNKQSAVYADDSEPEDMFDKVLLFGERSKSMSRFVPKSSQNGKSQENRKSKGSNGKKTRSKKEANMGAVVDLETLLTQCAQAVANYDQRNASDLLKQIRQHSSPHGDGTQRLAHYFANSLETRLAAVAPMYTTLVSSGASAADILKAYQVYITASPFKRMSNFYANRTIIKLAEKATLLHIIDFGICYGFQWPCLIQRLSERSGGAPMLRITGIELPQPGFRPAGRVEETGRRLENYCKRFNVPFEFNGIAKKWETIQLEDLKIDRSELTVVNIMYRLKHVPDDTVVLSSPRDTVLKLIRKIHPDVFIHGVVNGTYNAPFFATRFRETLFHYSALFDMFEENLIREDPQRLIFEREIFAKDAMNVIACEGAERVERPETYKQWQARNLRAGFKQLPLDQDILTKVKDMIKKEYHKDFIIEEDSKWMVQGWKGRAIYALSCWRPA
ncbi:Scarecrow-like protein [Quillaja saponaria]|uniref:Scarecrow-like protein n=1 Tax=Quillaja saponaria TaxID=32244 RepID=A0AAD7KXK8_QUISA|nr:Scarecrow-like protein [Quillaja saponaria]